MENSFNVKHKNLNNHDYVSNKKSYLKIKFIFNNLKFKVLIIILIKNI